MTLPQVYELMAYWETWPPLHVLAARVLGYRPNPRTPQARAGKVRAGIDGLLALAPDGMCRVEHLRGGADH
ncbi:MAG TPA: hypothetical protein VN832_01380 [Stellaceae bacterium]|nr:hypothetical protein [Stellaceae bacterium]